MYFGGVFCMIYVEINFPRQKSILTYISVTLFAVSFFWLCQLCDWKFLPLFSIKVAVRCFLFGNHWVDLLLFHCFLKIECNGDSVLCIEIQAFFYFHLTPFNFSSYLLEIILMVWLKKSYSCILATVALFNFQVPFFLALLSWLLVVGLKIKYTGK